MLKYKNKIIVSKIVYCNNIFRQGTGLMFHAKNAVRDTAWVFSFIKPRKLSITMFCVFYPIDIIFLDKNNKVVEMKKGLKPFSGYTPEFKISKFIELEHGIIERYDIRCGSTIKILDDS